MSIETETFCSHINAPDELIAVLRSHQDLDVLLADIINESLVESHFLEIERIPFSLKVELVVALGKIEKEARPALLRFNSIRNEFAHDSKTLLTEKSIRDFYNVFDGSMRSQIVGIHVYESFDDNVSRFRRLAGVLFVYLRSTLRNLRDQKLWDRAMHEEAESFLAESEKRNSPYYDSALEETQSGIRERFERLKREQLEGAGLSDAVIRAMLEKSRR
jgi:hypothetical protein